MFTLNSRDLRMCSSIISSRMISFQKVMVKSSQVLYPFLRSHDPVVLETEEQMLEREKNERVVLDVPGEYKCDVGMSLEDVPVIVNIKTLKSQLIAHKFNTGWTVGVVKSGKEEVCYWSVCSQV